jgi:hypothetical protein
MTVAPVCAGCGHPALYHEHDPLSCAHCALSPLAHAHGIGCGSYAPREAPASGARCNAPRCACAGYERREDGARRGA